MNYISGVSSKRYIFEQYDNTAWKSPECKYGKNIKTDPYTKNQQDALFTFNLFQ